MSEIEINKYLGLDISEKAIELCKEKYPNKNFQVFDGKKEYEKFDLALSLDVLYHIIEDEAYTKYMDKLFGGHDYIIIYSQNFEYKRRGHMKGREFLKDTSNYPDYFKIREIDQKFPDKSSAKFYIFKKEN